MKETFLDVGYYQVKKEGESAPGDAFLSRKAEGRQRMISILSDGLGSGIRASVLSSLTANMAMRAIEKNLPALQTAELISRTLPVCSERQISYATFTIVDIDEKGQVQILEYDNPRFILIRDGEITPLEESTITFNPGTVNRNKITSCNFTARPGDRLIFFSDGVTQSGLGTRLWPLGWGDDNVRFFIRKVLAREPDISSNDLARKVVKESLKNDVFKAKDDITCGSIYFRKPRKLIIATGPPYNPDRDRGLAEMIRDFEGKSIISGGTTANIVARELDRKIEVEMFSMTDEIPPSSLMEGVTLITEGIITLGKVSEYLTKNQQEPVTSGNPAQKIVEAMMDSDIIHFVVGTRINEAHQDPNIPMELEIRRNIVKKIADLMKEKFLKQIIMSYI